MLARTPRHGCGGRGRCRVPNAPASPDTGPRISTGVGPAYPPGPERPLVNASIQLRQERLDRSGVGHPQLGVQVPRPFGVIASRIDAATIAMDVRQALVGARLLGPIAQLARDGEGVAMVRQGLAGIAERSAGLPQSIERRGFVAPASQLAMSSSACR